MWVNKALQTRLLERLSNLEAEMRDLKAPLYIKVQDFDNIPEPTYIQQMYDGFIDRRYVTLSVHKFLDTLMELFDIRVTPQTHSINPMKMTVNAPQKVKRG